MHRTVDPQRGEDTRQKLIEAGVEVFAALGYKGASTRKLASVAEVNQAAIPYHFGGKEALYLAVAEHVAKSIGSHMLPATEEVKKALADSKLDKEHARAALHHFLKHFAHMFIELEAASLWAAFVQREHANPTAAFDILYEGVFRHVAETIGELLAILTDGQAESPENKIRVATILGQIVIFRTQRAGILRALGWDRFDEDRVAMILGVIRSQVDAIIDSVGERQS